MAVKRIVQGFLGVLYETNNWLPVVNAEGVCGMFTGAAAGVCINLAVHPNTIEKGEDFDGSAEKLDESPTESGSGTSSPSDNTSEDSAQPLEENRSLLHTHTHSAVQLLSNTVSPPRSVPTG